MITIISLCALVLSPWQLLICGLNTLSVIDKQVPTNIIVVDRPSATIAPTTVQFLQPATINLQSGSFKIQ